MSGDFTRWLLRTCRVDLMTNVLKTNQLNNFVTLNTPPRSPPTCEQESSTYAPNSMTMVDESLNDVLNAHEYLVRSPSKSPMKDKSTIEVIQGHCWTQVINIYSKVNECVEKEKAKASKKMTILWWLRKSQSLRNQRLLNVIKRSHRLQWTMKRTLLARRWLLIMAMRKSSTFEKIDD